MVEAIVGAEAFTQSSQRIVDYLNAHTPLSDWSVTRVTGGEQLHVHVHREDVLDVGARVRWDQTFCHRMVEGAAHVVPDSQADPDYASLPDAQTIGAYAGFPILDDDGTLFGVLCGVNLEPLADGIDIDAALVQLMGELLSSQLALSRSLDHDRRSAEIAEALAQTDALTGLLNRRGWDLLVADAQQRLDAYGDSIAVIVIDLDGLKGVNDTAGHAAGDVLLREAAAALAAVARDGDRVSRYGGDEFAVLANNVRADELDTHRHRFVDALAGAGIAASAGAALADPGVDGMAAAFSRADAAMYHDKRTRRPAD